MTRHHRQTSQFSVGLFPFLAVLVCAMGALILLLLVLTRRVRTEAVLRALNQRPVAASVATGRGEPGEPPIAKPSSSDVETTKACRQTDGPLQAEGKAIQTAAGSPTSASPKNVHGQAARSQEAMADVEPDGRGQLRSAGGEDQVGTLKAETDSTIKTADDSKSSGSKSSGRAGEADGAASPSGQPLSRQRSLTAVAEQGRSASGAGNRQAEKAAQTERLHQQRQEEVQASAKRLADLRKQVARIQEEEQEIERRLAGLREQRQQRLDQLQHWLATAQEKHAQADRLEAEKQRLAARIEQLRQQLTKARRRLQQARSKYAIVTYSGTSGTTRRPILIECVDDQLRFLPEGVSISRQQLDGFTLAYNPLLAGTKALIEFWTAWDRVNSPDDDEPEPYVLLLVRPSGAFMFYVARAVIEQAGLPCGYELLDEDWQLQLPEANPQAVSVCRKAVQEVLAERERLLQLLAQTDPLGRQRLNLHEQPERPHPFPAAQTDRTDEDRDNFSAETQSGWDDRLRPGRRSADGGAIALHSGRPSERRELEVQRSGEPGRLFDDGRSADQPESVPEETVAKPLQGRFSPPIAFFDESLFDQWLASNQPSGGSWLTGGELPEAGAEGRLADDGPARAAGHFGRQIVAGQVQTGLLGLQLFSHSTDRSWQPQQLWWPARLSRSSEQARSIQTSNSPVNWLPAKTGGLIGLERRLVCELRNGWVQVRGQPVIPVNAEMAGAELRQLVAQALQKATRDWGPAPKGFHWVPVVELVVYPGALLQETQLETWLHTEGVRTITRLAFE